MCLLSKINWPSYKIASLTVPLKRSALVGVSSRTTGEIKKVYTFNEPQKVTTAFILKIDLDSTVKA